jgi:hypothetical protein
MYFLSYATEDKPAAQALALGLQAAGLALWTDLLPGHLPLGQPFPGQLEEGIRASTGYLVLIGQRGIDGWVEDERNLALMHRRTLQKEKKSYPIVPLVLPGVNWTAQSYTIQLYPPVALERSPEAMDEEDFRRLRDRLLGHGEPPPAPRPRRKPWVALGTIGALAAVLGSISLVALQKTRPVDFTDPACTFQGTAREVVIRGEGLAVLTEDDALTGVRRVQLRNAQLLRYLGGSPETVAGATIIIEHPQSLIPTNATSAPYEASYLFGETLRMTLRRAVADNPGKVIGGHLAVDGTAQELGPDEERRITWMGPLVLDVARDLDWPRQWIALAGPFEGATRLELQGAQGRLSCYGTLTDATLTWQGSPFVLPRLELGPEGLRLEVTPGVPLRLERRHWWQ